MTFCMTRNYRHTQQKPAGLYRILCVGDSMTFGAGVSINEALPAQLESLLNRAVWNRHIEVINDGVSGYALYDDWHNFIHRGHRFQPDLVIVILCENDIELYNCRLGGGGPVPYQQHIDSCWHERSIHLPHYRRGFEEIRAQFDEVGVPVVIAYYQVYDGPVRERGVRITADICRANGLGFVDLSEDFTGRQSSTVDGKIRVSPEDPHPSAIAHTIAAQRLARHLVRSGLLSTDSEAPATESELYHRILENATQMGRAGYRPESILHHLDQVLAAKRNSKSRMQLPPEALQSECDFTRLQADIRRTAAVQARVMALEAYGMMLRYNAEMFYRGKVTADEQLMLISKKMYVLDNNLNDPSIWNYHYPKGAGAAHTAGEFVSFSARLRGQLSRVTGARDIIGNMHIETIEGLHLLTAGLTHRLEQSGHYSLRFLHECEVLLDACLNLRAYFDELHTLAQEKARQQQMEPALSNVAADLLNLATLVGKLTEMTHPEKIPALMEDKTIPEATYCTVKLKAAAADVTTIGVQLRAMIPELPPLFDVQYIIRDGKTHSYRFQLPLCLAGRICLVVSPPASVQIESVSCHTNEDHVVALGNKIKHEVVDGHLWITYEDPFWLI